MRHFSPATIGISLLAALACGCGASQAPDAAMRGVIQDLAQGRVSGIWHALPSRYQSDVTDITRMLADKLDPEIYDEGFALAREFLAVARDKQEIFEQFGPPQIKKFDMDRHGDALFDFCDAVMSGQVATVEGIRNLDVPRFLDQVGGGFMELLTTVAEDKGQDVGALLDGVTVTVQSMNGDRCVLAIGSSQMPMTFPLPCQLVDGKWVPAPLAAGWPRAINQLRKQVQAMPGMRDEATKKAMREKLKLAKKQLRALKRAQTDEQIRDVMEDMARPPK